MKRLAAEKPIVTIPVVVRERIPVPDPPVAVPDNIIGVLGIVRMAPQKLRDSRPCHCPLTAQSGCILFGDFISLTIAPSIFIFEILRQPSIQNRGLEYPRLFATSRFQPPAIVTAD